MKKLNLSLLWKIIALLLFLIPNLKTATSSADTTSNYQLTIVKYKLSDVDVQGSTLPKTPVGSAIEGSQAKGASGNMLSPLSGVSYKIEKVNPSNDVANPFEVDPNFKSETITTDATGQVTATLGEGIYRVTELANDGLTEPAAPVIVQLPMTTAQGQVLDHVYIYPKSSVVTEQSVAIAKTTPTAAIIPHTAGAIQPIQPVYWLLIGLVSVGLIGLIAFKPKKLRK